MSSLAQPLQVIAAAAPSPSTVARIHWLVNPNDHNSILANKLKLTSKF